MEFKKNLKIILDYIKKFWNYIWYDDSSLSYLLNFAVAFIIIKFIFFPSLGFILNNDYPVVAIVSGSMEHKIASNRICNNYVVDTSSMSLSQDEWWSYCGDYYKKNYNFSLEQFNSFDYVNGLNIGDVMILYGKNPQNIEVGEVLVFIPQDKMPNGESKFFTTNGPVIHRVVKKWQDNETEKIYFQTKGDHNPESFSNFETIIPQEDVIGVAVTRIPYIGYLKLLVYRSPEVIKSKLGLSLN